MAAVMSGKHVMLVKKVLKPEFRFEHPPQEEQMVCNICYHEFATKASLLRHQVVHSDNKPFVCYTCFREFNDASSLRKHLLIHQRSYQCPVCLKTFLRRRQMEVHLQRHSKKRFIYFGQKFREVNVNTFRNENDQLVHEFSLCSLLNQDNNNGNQCGDDASSRGKTVIAKDKSNSRIAALPNNLNCNDSGEKRVNELYESVPNQFSENQNSVETSITTTTTASTISPSSSATNNFSENKESIEISSAAPSLSKKMIYKCGHCKKLINTRATVSRHLMKHANEKPFQCEKCVKQFRHRNDLTNHYKTHLKPVKCQVCGSTFSKQLYLNRHIKESCPYYAQSATKDCTILSDNTYKCNLCGKILKSRPFMFRHMRVHAFEMRTVSAKSESKKISLTGDDNRNVFEESGVNANLESQPPETFIRPLVNSVGFSCAMCEQEFRFKSMIMIHIRMHLNQQPFKCNVCERAFYSNVQLLKHQVKHTKPHKCPKCGKNFSRRYLMTQHFNNTHSESAEEEMKDITVLPDKILQCDICGKRMKSYEKRLMQYHIRLHKDVRPHKCNVCQKSFTSNVALKKHALNHDRPYICNGCGKGFSRRYLMIEHFDQKCKFKFKLDAARKNEKQNKIVVERSTTATNAKGDVGNEEQENLNHKIMEEKTSGQIHYQTKIAIEVDKDSGAETYKCVPCDKTFERRSRLLKHVNTFAKESTCKYCKAVFVNKHLRIIHQRSCLGSKVALQTTVKDKPTTTALKSNSKRQETVFKAMQGINHVIESYRTKSSVSDDGSLSKRIKINTSNNGDNSDCANNVVNCGDSDSGYGVTCIIEDKREQNESDENGKKFKYSCSECDKSFSTTRGLKIHSSSHLKIYMCDRCGEDFEDIKAFRAHQLKENSLSESEARQDDSETTDVNMECEDGYADITKSSVEVEPSSECTGKKTDIYAKQSNTNNESLTETKSSVSHKENTSSSVSKMKHTHCKSVPGVTKGNLDESPKKENQFGSLLQSGTRGRPFSCCLCRKRFTEELGLILHMSKVHIGS